MRTTLLLIAALQGAGAIPDVAPPAWTPTWMRDYGSPLGAGAVSVASHCIVAAANGSAEVLDLGGRTLWRWDYSRVNRFINPGGGLPMSPSEAIAVSPACDAIAVIGDAGYRYTWIVDRRLRAVSVRTSSTPLSAAFAPDGRTVAIGTAGQDVVLAARDGAVRTKTTLEHWCCVVRQLSYAADGGTIAIHGWGTGVLAADGRVIWSESHTGMAASANRKTFVAWDVPNHGPGIPRFSALDEDGRVLWERLGSSPVISPDGAVIAARVYDNQNPTAEEAERGGSDTSLQMLSRDGRVVATLAGAFGSPIGVSNDGRQLLLMSPLGIDAVDRSGHVTRRIAPGGEAVVAPDFSAMLVIRRMGGVRLEWYRLTQEG